MILFFIGSDNLHYAIEVNEAQFENNYLNRLSWLFGGAKPIDQKSIEGYFIGPRKEMITPWSTNAVEITQNMGIRGIKRIEMFTKVDSPKTFYDPMLQALYTNPGQDLFSIDKKPESVEFIFDIAAYNKDEGLALSEDEVNYLNEVSKQINRRLTDSEVYGFAQVNSEHCRHKIFNGRFIINGKEMPESLFSLIKKTSKENPNKIVSAYKDNVAFIKGPVMEQFAPKRQDKPDYFAVKNFDSVISLKAETHNFPTTVEPFNGAATGSGGEIRDRLAGGKGSLPLAGSAVYMTSYPRLEKNRPWEQVFPERKWLYQSPREILTKASNGASDFGNKFGQPLICGSLFTFEQKDNVNPNLYGFDKVIMLAGGVGYGKMEDAQKDAPQKDDRIVVMGGDNYRIGMGGGAVSSVATGEFDNQIELNAVQRSNPEMQKRVANAIRAMVEMDKNPIVSIHDHGAGGHLNSISELVEESGGQVEIEKLPIGDPTLSGKEIIGNESQERMGLIMKPEYMDLLQKVSDRERAPIYDVGHCTGDQHFSFVSKTGKNPMDIDLAYLFGKPPQTVLTDFVKESRFSELEYDVKELKTYIDEVLSIEAVACKDWLTNKVDRSVTGKVAKQQCTGSVQLPLNNVGVMALDYKGIKGIATSVGHAPVPALIDAAKASHLAVAEALTNLVWAPLSFGLDGVSLSANWMWPAKNPGENARLYQAVKSLSEFVIELGINVPTGKDSLSMVQKYDDQKVISPGTVIISTVGEVSDIRKVITPELKDVENTEVLYIDFSKSEKELGGSSFAQTRSQLGNEVPDVADAKYFKKAFKAVQELIKSNQILAGHDISSGGMLVTLLEMCFPVNNLGLDLDFSSLKEEDIVKLLFAENPGVILQVDMNGKACSYLEEQGITYKKIGIVNQGRILHIEHQQELCCLDIDKLRDTWFRTSYLMECKQAKPELALARFKNYKKQEIKFKFPDHFKGTYSSYAIDPDRKTETGVKAAIIREKGVNGDREMAYMMYLAGFDVKDVHMTDLVNGREDLSDVNLIVFVGGFSNSDVLGSAKGWAGAFLYNDRAKLALDNFYARPDTLSLGVCNGCQLMTELNLIYPGKDQHPKMLHNASGKFEAAFLTVDVMENNSVMLKSLAGSRLGIHVAHGEGCFMLPENESAYQIPLKYSYNEYPGNPNGSPYATAALCSKDGRHLAMMPHLERAFYPWHWANYPMDRANDELTPWIEAFVNAREWIKNKTR